MKRIFVFSGQGSQYFQMGRELYDQDLAFRAAFDHYDTLAGVHRRRSLAEVIYGEQKPSDPFQQFEDTHFAIPVVQLALTDMLGFKGYYPDVVLGTSLGEYIALVVSQRLTAEALFELLARQIALLRTEFGDSDTGQGMVSVFVTDQAQAAGLLAFAGQFAGRVGADTLIFSGADAELQATLAYARRHGLLAQRLAVPYAFHSRLVERIGTAFQSGCPQLGPGDPTVEYRSCVVGSGHRYGPELLQAVMRQPFDFLTASQPLICRAGHEWVDISPGGIFTRPLRAALDAAGAPPSQAVTLLSVFGSDLGRLTNYQLTPRSTVARPRPARV